MSSIAETIYLQLGGAKFSVMTGAKDFIDQGTGLSFKFPRHNKVNYCKIMLNSLDTYDLEFGYIHGKSYKIKCEYKGHYNNMLQSTFTEVTGLDTHIPMFDTAPKKGCDHE